MSRKVITLRQTGEVPSGLKPDQIAVNTADAVLFTPTGDGGVEATPLGTPQMGDVSGLVALLDSIQSDVSGKAAAAHSHATSDITGLDDALAAKLPAASYTAADVLSKVLTVDGDSSGLDADKWKGRNLTVSASGPSGGADGDIWLEYE